MDFTLGLKRIHFYRSLADSARSGLTPLHALEQLSAYSTLLAPATLDGLRRQVQGGFTFSRAMRTYPDAFPAWEAEIVGVGETTGRMDTAFGSIAASLEEQRSFILSMLPGLAYPLFLLHIAPFLLNGAVYMERGTGPYLWSVFTFLLWFYIPAGAIAFMLAKGLVKLRSLPFLSALSKARFSQFLCAMLKGGVPLLKALDTAAGAAGVTPKGPQPPEGAGVAERLKVYAVYSPQELSHIADAEFSGRIGDALERLSEEARQSWQAALKSIAAILPPVFYLIIALSLAYRIFGGLRGYAGISGF